MKKSKNEINSNVDSIMNTILTYSKLGREYVTMEWITTHQLFGYVKKQSRHRITDIKREYVTINVTNLTDYHVL
jgi:light-regulated signal transduction histidine kinase (bacteriophytochrome)